MKLFAFVLASSIVGTALVASAGMPSGTVLLAPGDMHWTAGLRRQRDSGLRHSRAIRTAAAKPPAA